MIVRFAALLLTLGATSIAAHAQEFSAAARAQPILATARLASQGIGYSVVYQEPGRSAFHRIKVVCTVGQVSATAQCPSAAHYAFCPTAQIVCR